MVYQTATPMHKLRNSIGASNGAHNRKERLRKEAESRKEVLHMMGCRHQDPKTGIRCDAPTVPGTNHCKDH